MFHFFPALSPLSLSSSVPASSLSIFKSFFHLLGSYWGPEQFLQQKDVSQNLIKYPCSFRSKAYSTITMRYALYGIGPLDYQMHFKTTCRMSSSGNKQTPVGMDQCQRCFFQWPRFLQDFSCQPEPVNFLQFNYFILYYDNLTTMPISLDQLKRNIRQSVKFLILSKDARLVQHQK